MKNLQMKIENAIEKDKLMHFCVGLLLAQLIYLSLWFILLPPVIGIMKELFDKYVRSTGFNWWDLLATVLGVVPVLVVFLIM